MKIGGKGTSIRGLRPEMVAAFPMIEAAYLEVVGVEATLTCGTDAKHGEGSLHYVGLATDWRRRSDGASYYWDTNTTTSLVNAIKQRLGSEFDVAVEPTHIHIEYQPKGALNA